MCEKDYVGNRCTCVWEIGKCLKSIIRDSVVISDEIVEVTNLFQQKLFQKNILQ